MWLLGQHSLVLVPLPATLLLCPVGWWHLGPCPISQYPLWKENLSLINAGALVLVHRSCSTPVLCILLSARLHRVQEIVLKTMAPLVFALLATRHSFRLLSPEKLTMARFVHGLNVSTISPSGSTTRYSLPLIVNLLDIVLGLCLVFDHLVGDKNY